MHLKQLEEALAASGLYGRVQPPDRDYPVERLHVLLENDDGEDWLLEISTLPGLEGELESVSLLQYFVPVAGDYTAAARAELLQLFLPLNRLLPLAGFYLDDALVYYRYVLPLSLAAGAEMLPTLIEVTHLIHYFLTLYAEVVAAVATGHQTAAQVLTAGQS